MARIVLTGAFSNTGLAAAGELVRRGHAIHTLTRRSPPPGSSGITVAALRFDREHLRRELTGADVFVNTYWVRYAGHGATFEQAVANIELLIDVAREVGVKRFVHVSVSNAARGAHLGYYRGKAEVEQYLKRSGLAYAIVRPTLVVGPDDVLTNNIVWFIRRFPFFLVPSGGGYRLRPVTLADNGRLIADAALATEDLELDSAGPEVFTFREYLELLAEVAGVRRTFVRAPSALVMLAIRLVSWFVKDNVLAREELAGLEDELLMSDRPAGRESVTAWLRQHGQGFGVRYVNDKALHG